MQAFTLGRDRHRRDGLFDRVPQVVTEVARDARPVRRAPAARQRERIAGQIAGFGQPGEEGIQNDQRVPHAGRRQGPGKGAPVAVAAAELLAAGGAGERRRQLQAFERAGQRGRQAFQGVDREL
ncbi:hypothetical protein CF68_02720 [Cupriavidus sp. SK-4]|nr:hypothetical protein CF68_02720 [Cupriavidus sp. SK-4]